MTDAALVLAKESLTLEPLAHNVRRARRTVIDTLTGAGRPDLADSAALVTSELVTNALLHAGSQIRVTITVTTGGALVEVEDRSADVPRLRDYDLTATTGRGMTLIGSLVDAFGVRRLPGEGKVVWFTLGAVAAPSAPAGAPSSDDCVTVQLEHVPVGLFCTFQQVADGLLREFLLACRTDAGSAAHSEWAVANSAFAELAAAGAPAFAKRDTGVSHCDLAVEVAAAGAERFLALRRVLDRAVSLAGAGLLLSPPSQPEIVALRNWCCEQVVVQLGGQAASPWPPRASAAVVPAAAPVDWDTTEVTTSALAVLAADDANLLIAVSPAAASLLGWIAADLVGQRIVSIVPDSMREAHIAGFVRYLVTGERRILGSPVPVRALRRDGSEIDVVIQIELAATVDNRSVFTATMTPLS